MPNQKFKDIQVGQLVVILKKNIGIVCTILLAMLFFAEGYIVKDAVAVITGSGNTQSQQNASKASVRVDFENYDAAIQRIKDAPYYLSTSTKPLPNPFGTGTSK
jgi:hypothetical protein